METKPPIPPFTIEAARQKVRLVFDDVAGNNFFNTLGNIVSDPRVSLRFIDFAAAVSYASPATRRSSRR